METVIVRLLMKAKATDDLSRRFAFIEAAEEIERVSNQIKVGVRGTN